MENFDYLIIGTGSLFERYNHLNYYSFETKNLNLKKLNFLLFKKAYKNWLKNNFDLPFQLD